MSFPFVTFIHSVIFTIPFLFTPGPNNLLAIALGKQSGLKSNLPFILGVWIGQLVVYLFLCLLGKAVFQLFPGIQLYIIIAGSCYMLYLAWKTALAGKQDFKEKEIKNLTVGFGEAFSLQWVNPKGLAAQITIVSAFKQPSLTVNLVFFTILSTLALFDLSFWIIFGKSISPILQKNKKSNFIFHLILGAILAVLSIFFILDSTIKLTRIYA